MGSSVRQIESFEYDKDLLSREMANAKFKNFAKTNFQNLVRFDSSNINFLKWISQHYAYNLPEEINDFFININVAQFFWASHIPYIKSIEKILTAENKKNLSSNYPEIKKFYAQWVSQKDTREKEYYALSTINLIEHDSDQKNFLQNILYATILSFDTRIYSPDKAITLLDKSQNFLDDVQMETDLKNETLYLINLYAGFVHFRQGNMLAANQKFSDAQIVKQNGISALFYEALTQKQLGNNEISLERISKIVEFDKYRLNFAFRINSLNLFSYFLQTAFSYNIFSEMEFADMLFDIKTFFLADKKGFDEVCGMLVDSLEKLLVYEEDLEFDNDIRKEVEFIKKFVDQYRTSVNKLIPFSKKLLVQKFNSLIDFVLEKTTLRSQKLIDNNLFLYNQKIEIGARSKELLTQAAKKRKAELKSHLELEIKSIEEAHKQKVAQIEAIVENLGDEGKFDPSQAFSSSMIINIVVSLIIFIIGGFADGFLDSSNSANGTLFTTMISGIKWGGITFLLGTIVSFFSSISAIWERSNNKQKLIREISIRKNMKEKTIKEINRDFSEKMEEFEDQLRRKEKSIDRDIESLKKDREMKSGQLQEENNQVLEKYRDKLLAIKIQ